jgi:hypothetical protein
MTIVLKPSALTSMTTADGAQESESSDVVALIAV